MQRTRAQPLRQHPWCAHRRPHGTVLDPMMIPLLPQGPEAHGLLYAIDIAAVEVVVPRILPDA